MSHQDRRDPLPDDYQFPTNRKLEMSMRYVRQYDIVSHGGFRIDAYQTSDNGIVWTETAIQGEPQ
jgi:hypothetical protein